MHSPLLAEPRDAFTVEEFASIVRIGRNPAYRAVKRNDIPVIRVGKSLRISRAVIERILTDGTAAFTKQTDEEPAA
jgi:excisionase family DNA binding protein